MVGSGPQRPEQYGIKSLLFVRQLVCLTTITGDEYFFLSIVIVFFIPYLLCSYNIFIVTSIVCQFLEKYIIPVYLFIYCNIIYIILQLSRNL